MKNLPLSFCGIFFTLAFSWAGLVLAGHIQLGSLNTTTERIDGETGKPVKGNPLYPAAPTGLAMQGKQVYMSMGCIYCHTQQVRRQGVGTDYERGWGDRQSVARDYIWEDRVLLGTMRTGPDLRNVGSRLPESEWHHLHLYNPQITSESSIMPPFRFLYETRKIKEGSPSPKALNLPAEYSAPEGHEVVPTRRADALVAYLLSMRLDYSLPEAQLTQSQ